MKLALITLGFFVSTLILAAQPNRHQQQPPLSPSFWNGGQHGQHGHSINSNGNQNASANKNANGNSNDNTNNVNVNLKVKVGSGTGTTSGTKSNSTKSNGSSSSSSSSSSGSGSGTNNNAPNTGNTFAPQFTDSRSPSFVGGSFSPSSGVSPSYGTSGYGSPSYGAASYPTAGYTTPLPTLNGPAEDPNTAWLTVDVPNDQADVYLNGVKMPHKGLSRKFVTPPLNPRQTYNYALKVVWPDNTNGISTKKAYNANIELKAGDEIHHVVPNNNNNVVPPMPNDGPAPQKPAKIVDDKDDQLKALEAKLQTRLKLAKSLMDEGKKDKAKKWLDEIIESHPESKAADDARNLLRKLK